MHGSPRRSSRHRRERKRARRRTVAARILSSYVVILLVFIVAAGWSLWAQRGSAREAELLRSGYLPLSLSLRDLVANQDTWIADQTLDGSTSFQSSFS